MKKIIVLGIIASATIFASEHATAHWTYSADTGAAHWGELNPKYEMCKKGVNQSPIDVTGFVEADLTPLKFEDKGLSEEFVNNGHTVKVSFKKGSQLTVDGKEFDLIQYHFHTPSENHIDGKSYPMEAHLVHASNDGELAVVALMFEKGEVNKALEPLVKKMPMKAEDKSSMEEEKLTPYTILPKDRDHYRFNGSLTTPPCSEGVRWFVIKKPVSISQEQLKVFHEAMGTNNRPLNPLGARKVMK